MYDLVFLTHIPAFYKINLYNEIAKKNRIFVVFLSDDTDDKRADDFSSLHDCQFEFTVVNSGSFQKRNIIRSCIELWKIVKPLNSKKIIVSGWELPEFWLTIITRKKQELCLALESTIYESKYSGLHSVIKKLFLSRVEKVYASGKAHHKLLLALNYKGEVLITGGVGIINKPSFVQVENVYSRRFLYVGRLSEEKNLDLLISVFNRLPEFNLTIIGAGPLESSLKINANTNIEFLGRIENSQLPMFYLSHDYFILPSFSEPWGLVIDEAVYFGMPVIISERCGASDLIHNGINGFVFNPMEANELMSIVKGIDSKIYHEMFSNNIVNILDKDSLQVGCYD